ncbi:MAG: glycerate kinase [Dehalococcoidia bacterium]|nr:glycerate kinase [Dehalococcoidia bacterium]
MKVVIAPQAFKGGLSGLEAAAAIERGVLAALPGAETVKVPVADGGDGTLDALVTCTGGRMFTARVTGPLGEPIDAQWGAMGQGLESPAPCPARNGPKTAVIEMARASGLALVPPRRRDPRLTTTYGTGELIGEAIDRGYDKIIVGLGGSATNDGGVGMAQALGVRFLDSNGRDLPFGGASLVRLSRIDMSGLRMGLMGVTITAATDVVNPLCGPTGASAVYGPQKGASRRTVDSLDAALERFSRVVERSLGIDVKGVPRAGAAGGLGAGLIAFANARVESGVDLVCRVLGLSGFMKGADLVITGEGRADGSTAYDKAPVGVARVAKASGVETVVLVAGSLGRGYEELYRHGIDAVVPILNRPMSFEESLTRSRDLLAEATERTMRLLLAGSGLRTGGAA